MAEVIGLVRQHSSSGQPHVLVCAPSPEGNTLIGPYVKKALSMCARLCVFGTSMQCKRCVIFLTYQIPFNELYVKSSCEQCDFEMTNDGKFDAYFFVFEDKRL